MYTHAQKVHSLTRVARKVAGGARLGPGGRGLVDAGLAHARVEERVEAQVLLVPAVEGAAAKGRADQPDARVALVEEPQDHVRLGHALAEEGHAVLRPRELDVQPLPQRLLVREHVARRLVDRLEIHAHGLVGRHHMEVPVEGRALRALLGLAAEGACPVSTGGGTRLVRLVRGRGGGGGGRARPSCGACQWFACGA